MLLLLLLCVDGMSIFGKRTYLTFSCEMHWIELDMVLYITTIVLLFQQVGMIMNWTFSYCAAVGLLSEAELSNLWYRIKITSVRPTSYFQTLTSNKSASVLLVSVMLLKPAVMLLFGKTCKFSASFWRNSTGQKSLCWPKGGVWQTNFTVLNRKNNLSSIYFRCNLFLKLKEDR